MCSMLSNKAHSRIEIFGELLLNLRHLSGYVNITFPDKCLKFNSSFPKISIREWYEGVQYIYSQYNLLDRMLVSNSIIFLIAPKIQSDEINCTGGHTRTTTFFNFIVPFPSDEAEGWLSKGFDIYFCLTAQVHDFKETQMIFFDLPLCFHILHSQQHDFNSKPF